MRCKRYFIRYVEPLTSDPRLKGEVEGFKDRLARDGWAEYHSPVGFASPSFDRYGEARAEAEMIARIAPGGAMQVIGVTETGRLIVKKTIAAPRKIKRGS